MADSCATSRGQPDPARGQTGRLAGNSGFAWLWAGESLSLIGTQVTLVAVPLTAVLTLHVSGLGMGVVSAAGWAPIVLFGLGAGVWADRRNPWRIMLTGNICRALLIMIIPLLAALGQLNLVALVADVAAVGTFSVFFDIACQTFAPELVDDARLAQANSRLELSRSVSFLVGPTLAGFLVAAVSAPTALLVDAVSFLVAALLLVPIASRSRSVRRVNSPARSAVNAPGEVTLDGPTPAASSILQDIANGLRFVVRHQVLRVVITMAALSNLFISGAEALQILFASRELGLSTQVIGVCIGVAGGGALLGAVVTSAATKAIGETRTIAVGFLLTLAGVLSLALAPRIGATWFFAMTQVLFGFSGPLLNISLVTLRQKITPRAMLGRVNASARVLIMSSLPLGSLLFGIVADITGIRTTLLLVSGGLIAVCLLTAGPLLLRAPLPTR